MNTIDQLPELLVVAVSTVKSFEMINPGDEVPIKVMVVVENGLEKSVGEIIAGGSGKITATVCGVVVAVDVATDKEEVVVVSV